MRYFVRKKKRRGGEFGISWKEIGYGGVEM